jgi:serine/threonine protein phosphatase PrpC
MGTPPSTSDELDDSYDVKSDSHERQSPDDEPRATSHGAIEKPVIDQPPRWSAFDIGNDDTPVGRKSGRELRAELIVPDESKHGRRIWSHTTSSAIRAYGLLCPKIPKHCEDAPPLFFTPFAGNPGETFLGVFDGMGGAGAGRADFDEKGRPRMEMTEALLASRLARLALVKQIASGFTADRRAAKKALTDQLEKAAQGLKLESKSRIRGTLTKRLPTTLVLSRVLHESRSAGRLSARIVTWWSGDSRAFLLTPSDGLSALTSDHVRGDDQLEQLRSDPPIENVVNHSMDFYISESVTTVAEPFVLLLATDGVFGYLPSPGFLELGLLEALCAGSGAVAENLADFCTKYAADDVSAVMLVSGFKDAADIAYQFAGRLKILQERYSRIRSMNSNDDEWNAEVEHLWELEKPAYRRLLGGASD